MNNKKSIVTLAIITLFNVMMAISCTHKSQISAVSFNKDIIPILTTSCALNSSCHSGANSTNLEISFDSSTAYITITSKGLLNLSNPSASLLYVEVQGNGTAEMPKPPLAALSFAQQAEILEWIKQGAQNN